MEKDLTLSINPNIYFGFPKKSPLFALGELVIAAIGTSEVMGAIQGIFWPSGIGEEKEKEWHYLLEIHAHLGDGSITLNQEFGSIYRCESSLEDCSPQTLEMIAQAENSLWMYSAGTVDMTVDMEELV